jgi:hypothetical protein
MVRLWLPVKVQLNVRFGVPEQAGEKIVKKAGELKLVALRVTLALFATVTVRFCD